MSTYHYDPNIEKLYTDLLKLNLKKLTPEQNSETWEVVKLLYKKERRKRWRIVLTRVAIGLSAAAVIGTIIYKAKESSTTGEKD